MTKKILLINSDLAKNRGDRAIAEGVIYLTRKQFPDAHITGLSQFPVRDKQWFGIDFLDMNFQSLSPVDLFRLCRQAKQSDLVLWGGGEILKDYTNKAALWYWVVKITAITYFNPATIGAFQGIGPTKAQLSKKLIAYIMNRCQAFTVRDEESYKKLQQWGAKTEKLYWASDPALLPAAQPISATLRRKLKKTYGIDESFLDNFICISPRDWFHYKQAGILPFAYRKKLYKLIGKKEADNPSYNLYLQQLEKLTAELSGKHATNILLLPMHMSEDIPLTSKLAAAAGKTRAVVLGEDALSPSEMRSVLASAKAMVGFRLHSTIIAVSANVPSINIYYVDKGRVFFNQIKQSRYSLPIEEALDSDFVPKVTQLLDDVLARRSDIARELAGASDKLKRQIHDAFKKAVET